jgi:integrase
MSEKRVSVWIHHYADRAHLILMWVDPDTGRRKSKSAETADPKVAEDKRVDLESDLNNGRHQEASRMAWERFRELITEQYVSQLRPATRHVYANVFNLFERICNPRRLRSITEQTISTFATGLRKTAGNGGGTMQPSTVRARLRTLQSALRWAVGQKLIPACPNFPEVCAPKKKPQPVPTETFERLLAKASDAQTKAFFQCGWLAGLRIGEALALEWEQTEESPWVDFAADKIRFPAAFVKAAEDQWVPLDPVLRAALEALPRAGAKVFKFISRETGGPLTKTAMSCRVRELARAAGVRLTYHSLRKGFGCRYAGKVPAQVLKGLMRHSSVAITMTYYANVDDAVMQAVLGAERNTLRNTAEKQTGPSAAGNDARASGESVNADGGQPGRRPLNG